MNETQSIFAGWEPFPLCDEPLKGRGTSAFLFCPELSWDPEKVTVMKGSQPSGPGFHPRKVGVLKTSKSICFTKSRVEAQVECLASSNIVVLVSMQGAPGSALNEKAQYFL